MMKINPSNRLNRRYILVKGSFDSFEKAILEYIGVLGFAKASPMLVKKTSDRMIVAVNREELINVRAALALSKDKMEILRVSGTIKGLDK